MSEKKPGKNTILVADDSMSARAALSKHLQNEGYHVLTAVNGREAINIFGSEKVDCMVLDLLMPVMDGLEVLKYIKDEKIKMPVVVFSADIQDSTRKTVYELGINVFLNKPLLDFAPIVEAVNNILKHGE